LTCKIDLFFQWWLGWYLWRFYLARIFTKSAIFLWKLQCLPHYPWCYWGLHYNLMCLFHHFHRWSRLMIGEENRPLSQVYFFQSYVLVLLQFGSLWYSTHALHPNRIKIYETQFIALNRIYTWLKFWVLYFWNCLISWSKWGPLCILSITNHFLCISFTKIQNTALHQPRYLLDHNLVLLRLKFIRLAISKLTIW